MIERINVYYDGSVGPEEPGEHGAYAFLIYDNEEMTYKESSYWTVKGDERIANLVVKYFSLVKALEYLIKKKKIKNHVRFYGDTLEIVNHLNKRFPFNVNHDHKITSDEWRGIWLPEPQYEPLKREVIRLASKFRDIQFGWGSKTQIKEARDLAESELLKKDVNPTRITKELEKQKFMARNK